MLKISQFMLRGPSGEIREAVFKKLLEVGLYLSGREGTTLNETLGIIEQQFFGIELERDIAEKFLNQLVLQEGTVSVEQGRYFLDAERRSQIEDYAKKTLSLISSTEEKIWQDVSKTYGKAVSAADRETLISCFYQFIILFLERNINDVAKLITSGILRRIRLRMGVNLVNLSSTTIKDQELREAFKKAVLDLMMNPDEEFLRFLFNMRQNFLCIQVLNLDPECKIIQREEFPRKRFFLDTNVLMSLVLKADRDHKQTEIFISNTRRLGCTLCATRKTIEEFRTVLQRANRLYSSIKASPKHLARVNNVFIRTFGMSQIGRPSLSWKDYIDQFSNMESLLEDLGMQILEEEHGEITLLPGFAQLAEEVQRCFIKFRRAVKTQEVAEHDAYHLLLVKTLREDEDISGFLGPNTWFLTLDTTLPCTERLIRRDFTFTDPTTPVMIGYVWDEIIAPFLVGIVEEEDLLSVFRTFVTSDFTPIVEGIDADALATLEVDWTEYEWLDIEEIEEILRQNFVLDYITHRRQLFKAEDRKAEEELRLEFNRKWSRLIGHISQRKIDQVRSELEETKAETKQLRSSVEDLEGDKETLQSRLTRTEKLVLVMRYCALISGLLLLTIGIYEIALMGETATWQLASAYIACLVIGAIVLLIAIEPQRVSAKLGFEVKK